MDIDEFLKRGPIAREGISLVVPVTPDSGFDLPYVEGWRKVIRDAGNESELVVCLHGMNSESPEGRRYAETGENVTVKNFNDGCGNFLRAGLKAASHPIVLLLDCRLRLSCDALKQMLKLIDQVDIVTLARQSQHSSSRWRRLLFSWVNYFVFAAPMSDPESGTILCRRSAALKIPLQSDSPFAYTELVAKATFLNMLIAEIAAESSEPAPGLQTNWSKMWKDAWMVFRSPEFTFSTPAAPEQAPKQRARRRKRR